MLKAENLTVAFGPSPVLDDLTVSFLPGQLTAVLGHNGAGKTTLLKTILGFRQPSAGSITVDGTPVSRFSAAQRAKLLAYVPQRGDGGFQYSAEDFVSMGITAYLGLFSRPGEAELQQAKSILTDLGCGNLIGRSMAKLSGGESRMVYLARAIMQDAAYLLLDEPVASLDLSRQHLFLAALRDYIARRHAGAVMTVHDPALAYRYAHRILLLHDRKLLLDVSTDDPTHRRRLAEGIRTVYGAQADTFFRQQDLYIAWNPDRPPADAAE